MKFHNISGVILAGGVNSRFGGKIKANLVLDGKTIISGITELLSHIFSEIIIVTNTPAEFSEYSKYKIVDDHFKQAGPLGGIHAAMKASTGEAVFIVAGDMPLLDKNIIVKQAKDFLKTKCEVLIPLVNNNIEPLHSVCSLSILNKLEQHLFTGSIYTVREFFKETDLRYLELESGDETENAFININSPSDMVRVEEILKSRR